MPRPRPVTARHRVHHRRRVSFPVVLIAEIALAACSPTSAHRLAAPSTEPTTKVTESIVAPAHPAPLVALCFWDGGTAEISPSSVRDPVARLSDVTDMPYICQNLCVGGDGCGDPRFWSVVRDGKEAIPYLLDALQDPTPTEASVPNIGGVYAVGDVALTALGEIVHGIPISALTGVAPSQDCGTCAWWRFVRADPANRRVVKAKVMNWIKKHEPNLVWRDDGFLLTVDCVEQCTHPASGYYEVSER